MSRKQTGKQTETYTYKGEPCTARVGTLRSLADELRPLLSERDFIELAGIAGRLVPTFDEAATHTPDYEWLERWFRAAIEARQAERDGAPIRAAGRPRLQSVAEILAALEPQLNAARHVRELARDAGIESERRQLRQDLGYERPPLPKVVADPLAEVVGAYGAHPFRTLAQLQAIAQAAWILSQARHRGGGLPEAEAFWDLSQLCDKAARDAKKAAGRPRKKRVSSELPASAKVSRKSKAPPKDPKIKRQKARRPRKS